MKKIKTAIGLFVLSLSLWACSPSGKKPDMYIEKAALTTQCHLDKDDTKNRVYRNICPVLFYNLFL